MLDPGVRSAAAAAVGLSVAVAIVRPNTTFCCRACRRLVLRQPKGRWQRGAAFIVSVGPGELRGGGGRDSRFEVDESSNLVELPVSIGPWWGESSGLGPIEICRCPISVGRSFAREHTQLDPDDLTTTGSAAFAPPPSTSSAILLVMSAAVCRHSLRIGSRNLASLPTAASGQTRWLSSTPPSRGKDCVHFNLDLGQED